MASRLFFGGRLYTSPATVSQVSDEAMAPRNTPTGNDLAYVGTALGGKPNTKLKFQDPAEAKRVLRAGEGLVAVRKGFSPSAQTGGPRTITFIRVGTATQSALALKDSADAAVIDLKSELYGIPANSIRLKIESGSLSGKKITTQLFDEYYVGDNIGRDAFRVRYAGAEATATMDVTNTQVVLKAGSATVATIPLVDHPTTQELCDRINTVAGFTAVPVAGSELKATPAALDTVTAQDVKTALYTAKADLDAIVEWFNSNAEPFIEATRKASVGTLPANMPFTFLTGATDPAPTVEDWTNAIDVLQGVDIQWFVPLSDNPAVHAAADAHAIFMSGAGRKERRACVGPAIGTTIANVKAAAKALASDRTAMCYPGHYDFDAKGKRVLLPSYMTAALVAGGMAGVNPGVAMTNKVLRMSGLELELRNPVDTDELIAAGVLCVESTDEGYKVVRSISTHLASDNFNRVELSCGAAADFVVRSVRQRLDFLRGGPASPQTLHEALAITASTLTDMAKPAPAGPGLLVGDENSPPFSDIQGSVTGDITNVTFTCSPVVPNNFITLGVSLRPYSGQASL